MPEAQRLDARDMSDLQNDEPLPAQWVKRVDNFSRFQRSIGSECSSLGVRPRSRTASFKARSNPLRADLRGAVLACLLRVPTRTEHARRLGAYPNGPTAAQARSGRPTDPAAVFLDYRGRHHGLL
jgi:hypothetical protein